MKIVLMVISIILFRITVTAVVSSIVGERKSGVD